MSWLPNGPLHADDVCLVEPVVVVDADDVSLIEVFGLWNGNLGT